MNRKYNKTALVTGASRGIGLGFVKKLINEGYFVVATCKFPDSSELVELQKCNPDLIKVIKLDITSLVELAQLKENIRDLPIDLLISNAAIFGNIMDDHSFDPSKFIEVMNVNALYPIIVVISLLENILMSTQKQVISITSQGGSLGCHANWYNFDPSNYHLFKDIDGAYRTVKELIYNKAPSITIIPYCFSKAFINVMMSLLSIILSEKEVKILSIHPGEVDTELNPFVAFSNHNTITVEQSVEEMFKIIKHSSLYRSGSILDRQGNYIEDLLNAKPIINP